MTWEPLPVEERARAVFAVTAVLFLVALAFGAGWWALLVAGIVAGVGMWASRYL